MMKVKVKSGDLTKFLNAWDREAYGLNVELRKMYQKLKKEKVILRKKEGFAFRAHK